MAEMPGVREISKVHEWACGKCTFINRSKASNGSKANIFFICGFVRLRKQIPRDVQSVKSESTLPVPDGNELPPKPRKAFEHSKPSHPRQLSSNHSESRQSSSNHSDSRTSTPSHSESHPSRGHSNLSLPTQ
eukprot:884756_1